MKLGFLAYFGVRTSFRTTFMKEKKPVRVISTELANTKVGSMSFCTYVQGLDRDV